MARYYRRNDRNQRNDKLGYFKDFFTNNPVDYILKDKNKDEVDEYLNKIDEYVNKNARSIKTSQLRNIFSRIKSIRQTEKGIKELKMLRFKLAYVAGRSDNKSMKELISLLDELIKKVNENNLDNFKDFFEAIISYHKFYGGK